MARLLAIMGSGETAPTMVKPHRQLFDQLGSDVSAALLDTPVGFQENADDISQRALQYFAESVGRTVDLVSLKSTEEISTLDAEAALSALRSADWVFAGPGSPTYTLRQWERIPLRETLAEKLRSEGCVVFASAAALTLGAWTVPVYEVYKAGEDPYWLDGLDLLSDIGLKVAVIPHYDNAEGGNHDTRFCYLGERRLALLEPELPDDAFVLGVDEHTGLFLDLDANSATVVGRGVVTVRRRGQSVTIPVGTTMPIDDLRALAFDEMGGAAVGAGSTEAEPSEAAANSVVPAPSVDDNSETLNNPLLEATRDLEAAFEAAVDAGDAGGATEAVLDLEEQIRAWATDTNVGPEADRARAALRSMIVRLGDLALVGVRDPREPVEPFVELLLDLRRTARADKDFSLSDRIRDGLTETGVEVRDDQTGTSWSLAQ